MVFIPPIFFFSISYHYSFTYSLFIYIHLTVSTGSFCVKEKILKISHLHTCVFINVVRNRYLLLSIVPFIETLDLREFSQY